MDEKKLSELKQLIHNLRCDINELPVATNELQECRSTLRQIDNLIKTL